MKTPLREYLDRPRRYDQSDGTGEMFMGWMLLAFALPGCLQLVLPEQSPWRRGPGSIALLFGILIAMLVVGLVVQRAVKSRIVWPRTGYVAFNTGGASWWTMLAATFVAAGALAAGLAWLFGRERGQSGDLSLLRSGYSLLWVALYAFWILRAARGQRWKWLVAILMALGLAIIDRVAAGGFVERSRPVLLFVGLVWLGSGAATLYSYIRHSRRAGSEAE